MATIQRVLMTTDTLGGVWNYSLQLAESLAHFGIQIVLAAMGRKPSDDQKKEAARLSNVTLLESDFKLEWMTEPWLDISQAMYWLKKIEKDFAPDVIHLNQFSFASTNWNAPVLLVAHSCVCSWRDAVRPSEPLDPQFTRYCKVVRHSLQNADCVVTPTATMMRSLHHHYRVTMQRTAVIPNGRNCKGLKSEKKPFILSAGRIWDDAKNIRILLDLADELCWPLYIAGDTRGQPIRESESIHCLGMLPFSELSSWLAEASIFALPALYEPFGLTILEAALNRCALVLGNIDSLRENWWQSALFVNPRTSGQIQAAIRRLVFHEDLRTHFAKQAYERAMEFSAERMSYNYLRLYESLCPSKERLDIAEKVVSFEPAHS